MVEAKTQDRVYSYLSVEDLNYKQDRELFAQYLVSLSVEFAVLRGVGVEKALVQLNYLQSHYTSGVLPTRFLQSAVLIQVMQLSLEVES